MKRIFKILNTLILIWGYFCLLAAGLIAVQIAWTYIKWSDPDQNFEVSSNEAEKVVHRLLGWRETKVEKVIYSHESPRSFTGDGVDVYYVQLDSIPSLDDGPYHWDRGDSLSAIGKQSIEFMDGWKEAKHLDDFHSPDGDLMNPENYFYFRSARFNGDFVSDATVIMINPSKRLYYYFSGNT